MQWLKAIAFFTGMGLFTARKITDIRTEKLQAVGNHATQCAEADNTDFESGNFACDAVPGFSVKAVQAAHQFADHILHHALIAIIAYAGHYNRSEERRVGKECKSPAA